MYSVVRCISLVLSPTLFEDFQIFLKHTLDNIEIHPNFLQKLWREIFFFLGGGGGEGMQEGEGSLNPKSRFLN